MLMALLRRFPCRASDLGIVPDEPAAIDDKIKLGLSHDILLVTGGMSMGERDYVPAILRRLGAELKITKLRIKPGKPFVFAEFPGGKFVVWAAGKSGQCVRMHGLPGFAAADENGGGAGRRKSGLRAAFAGAGCERPADVLPAGDF